MALVDEIKAYDQRQIKVMLARLNFCTSKKVSDDVASDLIGLCNMLHEINSDWKNKFLNLCNKLDYIYDIAAYEKREELTLEEQEESKELIDTLKEMVVSLLIQNDE